MSRTTAPGTLRRRPAKKESIETLLALCRPEVILKRIHLGLDQTIRGTMNQMLGAKAREPKLQRALEPVAAKVTAAVRAECNWNSLWPQIVERYRETFSQQEIEALIRFYQSDAGRAILNAMPVHLDRSMTLVQIQQRHLLPKLEQAVEEAVRQANPVRARFE